MVIANSGQSDHILEAVVEKIRRGLDLLVESGYTDVAKAVDVDFGL
jgi:hypothetical protein